MPRQRKGPIQHHGHRGAGEPGQLVLDYQEKEELHFLGRKRAGGVRRLPGSSERGQQGRVVGDGDLKALQRPAVLGRGQDARLTSRRRLPDSDAQDVLVDHRNGARRQRGIDRPSRDRKRARHGRISSHLHQVDHGVSGESVGHQVEPQNGDFLRDHWTGRKLDQP